MGYWTELGNKFHEEPFFVIILELSLRISGYICSIWSSPSMLIYWGFHHLGGILDEELDGIAYIPFAFLRFLLPLFMIIVTLVQFFVPAIIIAMSLVSTAVIGTVLGYPIFSISLLGLVGCFAIVVISIIVWCLGVWATLHYWTFLPESVFSLDQSFQYFIHSLIDLLSVLLFIHNCLLIVRIPSVVMGSFRKDHGGTFFDHMKVEAPLSYLTIIRYFVYLLHLLTFWRIRRLIFIKSEYTMDIDIGTHASLTLNVIKNFLMGFVDIPHMALAILIYLSWRRLKDKKFLESFLPGEVNDDEERYTELWSTFWKIILDIPAFFAYAVIFILHYRYRIMKRVIKQNKEGWRGCIHFQLVYHFVDLISIGPFAFVFVLRYRLNNLKRDIGLLSWEETYDGVEPHLNALYQSFLHILDIPFIILSIPVFLSIYRTKPMIEMLDFKNMEMNASERYLVVLFQLVSFPYDFVALHVLIFCVIFHWRYKNLVAHMEAIKDKRTERKGWRCNWDHHNEIIITAAKVIRDIPFIFLFFVSVPFVWRSFFTLRMVFIRPMNSIVRYKLILVNLAGSIRDVVTIPAAFLLANTIWRSEEGIKVIKYHIQDKTRIYNTKQLEDMIFVENFMDEVNMTLEVYKNLLALLVDIPFIVPSIIIFLTGWRASILVRKFKSARGKDVTSQYAKRRIIVVKEFIRWLFDFPTMIVALFLIVTFWRANPLIRELKRASKDEDEDYEDIPPRLRPHRSFHKIVYLQLWYLILDIPFMLLTVLLLLSIWRIWAFKKLIKDRHDMNGRQIRTFIGKNAMLTFADLPVLVMFILLTLSWRVRTFYHRLNREFMNPLPGEKSKSIYAIVISEFREYILDIPHVILAIICVWRLPFMVYIMFFSRYKDEFPNDTIRRRYVLKQFGKLILDIPSIAFVLFIAVTLIRLPALLNAIRKLDRDKNEHRVVFMIFRSTIMDLPGVFLAPLMLLAPWRFFLLRRHLKEVGLDRKTILKAFIADTPDERILWEVRVHIILDSLYTFVDILFFTFSLLLLVCPYRFGLFIVDCLHTRKTSGKYYSEWWKNRFRKERLISQRYWDNWWRLLPYHHAMIIVDTAAHVCFVFVHFVTPWRIPTVRYLYKKEGKYHKAVFTTAKLGAIDILSILGTIYIFIMILAVPKFLKEVKRLTLAFIALRKNLTYVERKAAEELEEALNRGTTLKKGTHFLDMKDIVGIDLGYIDIIAWRYILREKIAECDEQVNKLYTKLLKHERSVSFKVTNQIFSDEKCLAKENKNKAIKVPVSSSDMLKDTYFIAEYDGQVELPQPVDVEPSAPQANDMQTEEGEQFEGMAELPGMLRRDDSGGQLVEEIMDEQGCEDGEVTPTQDNIGQKSRNEEGSEELVKIQAQSSTATKKLEEEVKEFMEVKEKISKLERSRLDMFEMLKVSSYGLDIHRRQYSEAILKQKAEEDYNEGLKQLGPSPVAKSLKELQKRRDMTETCYNQLESDYLISIYLKEAGGIKAPPSLSLYWDAIFECFCYALTRTPHTLLMPLKILAIPSFFLFVVILSLAYARGVFRKPYTPLSYVGYGYPIPWIIYHCLRTLSFDKAQYFVVLATAGFMLECAASLSVLLSYLYIFYLNIVTLGIQFWGGRLYKFILNQNNGLRSISNDIVLSFFLTFQFITFFVFVITCIVPVGVYIVPVVTAILIDIFFIKLPIASVSTSVIAIIVFFFIMFNLVGAWWITYMYILRHMPYFKPFHVFGVVALFIYQAAYERRMYYFYANILGKASYRSQRLGLLGQFTVTIAGVVWILWPNILPFLGVLGFFGFIWPPFFAFFLMFLLFIPTIVISIIFSVASVGIIKEKWGQSARHNSYSKYERRMDENVSMEFLLEHFGDMEELRKRKSKFMVKEFFDKNILENYPLKKNLINKIRVTET